MKVLVTGAAGFIGAFTSKSLIESGHEVVGIDNLNDYYDVNLKHGRLGWLNELDGFKFYELDVADTSGINKLFSGYKFDRVIHLAAQAGVRYSLQNPQAYIQSNLVGFGNILEACRHNEIEHLVYASSSSVYGMNSKIPYATSDRVDHPVSLYAASKKSNELMAHSYSHLYGLPTTGLRFFTAYGPWGRPDMAYFSFTQKITKGETIDIYNFGKMRRDFTYIEDIVSGVVKVMDRIPQIDENWNTIEGDASQSSAPYKIYNIGNHNPVELGEFVSTLEGVIGAEANKNYMEIQPGDVLATFADVDDLSRDVGFTPSTDLKTGLTKFYDWYKGFYHV